MYFMPVVQNHLISHQWMRELKRNGVRVMVGVYFNLPSDEMVWAGRYDEPHVNVTLGQAIAVLNARADPLGFEMFTQRKIHPSEIVRIRHMEKVVGWRYMPHAHGRPPCPCPICSRGKIRSQRIRQRDDTGPPVPSWLEIKARLSGSVDDETLADSFWPLRLKRRTADPAFLEPYLELKDFALVEEVALSLAYFRHPNSRRLLGRLLHHEDASVRLAAANAVDALNAGRKPVE
ncbi:MAG: HEAT repeat domain-containing protein [Betaproteobacteria bacterium]|nr:HEAT repeat domain-containing protein [Betaproteobacteria bacterium]